MTETTLQVLEKLVAELPAIGNIENPDWTDCAQSWRAYVPKELRETWGELSPDARLISVILGERLVDRERWE